MVIKRIRLPLLMLIAVFVLSAISPMMVSAAATTPPSGFTGMDSVDLEVDSGYAWHKMSDTEATAYGLEDYKGTDVYIAGNSDTGSRAVSNLAITVTKPGSLIFDYALETRSGYAQYLLGYRLDTPIITDNSVDNTNVTPTIAGGIVGAWESCTISITQDDIGDDGTLTIYIAYLRNGTNTADCGKNFAAIRNITYTTGNRSNVVQFEDGYESKMGGVAAELITVTETTDDAGKTTTTTSYTAADVTDLAVGSTYRLKATANAGYQFYGWVRHYTYNSKNYTAFYPYETSGTEITVDADTYYVPVFAAKGTYYIRNGTNFYTTDTPIDTVLNNASSGNTVVLLGDYTVPEDVTELVVPAGVNFYIPFRGEWGTPEYGKPAENKGPTYHKNGSFGGGISTVDKAYATLHIPATATLKVNGNLILGAERNYASQDGFQGHISGRFGRIHNEGNIVMNSGSVATCYGLIDGNGTMLAKDGSAVKESLVISDFSGGNNSLQLYNQDQMPFKRYAAQNVQCCLKMEAKSALSAMAVLYAMGGHNEVDVQLLGDSASVVFRTTQTAANTVILERTYDASKQIASGSGNNTKGVGLSTWNISGGLKFQTLTISLEGVISLNTARAVFPVPYNMNLVLNDGTYTVNSGLALLPGAKLTVNNGATVDLGGKLYVYDGLVQSAMSGDKYPTRSDLTNAGFKGYGEFILNGNMYVHSGASVGGVIQSTTNGAMLTIEEGVYLDNGSAKLMQLDATQKSFIKQSETLFDEWVIVGRNDAGIITTIKNWVIQDGGAGHYDDNTTWFNLPGRIWNGTEMAQLQAGTYLSKVGSSSQISDTFVARYVPEIAGGTESGGLTYNTADGKRYMNDGTETFTRTVSGAWVAKSEGVEVTSATVAGSDKSGTLTAGVTLETAFAANADGSYLLTVSPKKDGADFTTKMVYLIKCTNADTTVANAEVTDGGWTLPAGTVSVTIESAVLGDAKPDGKLNNADLILLRRELLAAGEHLDELGASAADMKESGTLNNADLILLRRALIA